MILCTKFSHSIFRNQKLKPITVFNAYFNLCFNFNLEKHSRKSSITLSWFESGTSDNVDPNFYIYGSPIWRVLRNPNPRGWRTYSCRWEKYGRKMQSRFNNSGIFVVTSIKNIWQPCLSFSWWIIWRRPGNRRMWSLLFLLLFLNATNDPSEQKDRKEQKDK